MLLVCDIGNSNIVFGLYDGDSLAAHWRITSRLNSTFETTLPTERTACRAPALRSVMFTEKADPYSGWPLL